MFNISKNTLKHKNLKFTILLIVIAISSRVFLKANAAKKKNSAI